MKKSHVIYHIDSTAEDRVFHRDVSRQYKVAALGTGARFVDETGHEFLDGSSGSYVCNVGHGQAEIVQAIYDQAIKLAFVNTRVFTSDAELGLARRLSSVAPMKESRVYLGSSGTAANEAAVKMAYQYHVLRGHPEKREVIARWRSYHGSSVGSLSLTGDRHKRSIFEPILVDRPHVEPPYCFRCPWNKERATCNLECADAVEDEILRLGPENVSAIITEPVSGAPLGSLGVPDGYFERLRDVCSRYDVLMIVDEVISGMGRTGAWFATSHYNVSPDIITLGKGLAGGFSPIGALVVSGDVFSEFTERHANFVHYETFTGHTLSAAAACAVFDFIDSRGLVNRVAQKGVEFGQMLRQLCDLPIVGHVRGRGYLWALELVQPDGTNKPFPTDLRMADKIVDAALEEGLLLISGRGAADGIQGDTVAIAPPYVATDDDLDDMVAVLRRVLEKVSRSI